jgi:hypothetical protein
MVLRAGKKAKQGLMCRALPRCESSTKLLGDKGTWRRMCLGLAAAQIWNVHKCAEHRNAAQALGDGLPGFNGDRTSMGFMSSFSEEHTNQVRIK